MDIIIVNDFGHINGGTSQVAITSAMELADRGYQVYFFCAVSPVDERLVSNEHVRVICTGQPDILNNKNRFGAAFSGLWNFRSAWKFKNLLVSLSPQNTVVHIHGWTKALSHSVIHTALNSGFPVVLTMHDYFIACPNGGFYNYQKNTICPLKALSPNCLFSNCDSRSYTQKLWRYLRGLIQNYIVRIPQRVTALIAVSETSQNILTPYLSKNDISRLLPNHISAEKKERVRVEENVAFYFIGRLSVEKGPDLAALAAKQANVELVFIGDGPMKESLIEQFPNAKYLGWLSKHDLFEELKNARAVIFSSRTYETQGMVIMETASAGIPCIVSDITCGKDYIADKKNGLLFKSNDKSDLEQKISLIKNDDNYLRFLSENAFDHFWTTYTSKEEYINTLVEIYKSVSLRVTK